MSRFFTVHVIDGVNDLLLGPRADFTLVLTKKEGAPGSFQRSLNIELAGDLKTIAAQYPRLAFDHTGHVYCVYRWSDRRKDSPHHGAAIMVARMSEERLASGKATLADVEKRVACEMAAEE